MQGTIIKGIGSFYTVLCEDKTEYVCKARGRFRKDRITPLVGDRVEFTVENTGNSFITDILPRKNSLVRPAAANIDKLIIVMSATVPKPDFFLTDKLLATCEMLNICPVIVVNKCDDTDAGSGMEKIQKEYGKCGYDMHFVSAKTGQGIDKLTQAMKGSICCFAGQSAVGKSSVLNAINPTYSLETGELSRKTERGRHTTRHCELIPTENGAYLDTPGFSLVEFFEIDPKTLCGLYPEMRGKEKDCRFTGCVHIGEPDCAVKEYLSQGGISQGRYDRYIVIYKELDELFRHRYDKTRFHEKKENEDD